MKAGSTHTNDRAGMLWAFAITSIALFMTTLDNLVVTTALPVIRTICTRAAGARVDRKRLHAHLRGPAPHRRRARRPLRPAPSVRDRARHLHRRLRPGGARRLGERTDCGPRDSGARRSDRAAADLDDSLRGRATQAPRSRARRLGRDRRA